jgi:hypothetical protein
MVDHLVGEHLELHPDRQGLQDVDLELTARGMRRGDHAAAPSTPTDVAAAEHRVLVDAGGADLPDQHVDTR